jgi:hypothetical protein
MKTKQRQSESMSQIETLPQSIASTKTILLKPRLDESDILLIGQEIKSRLFSKFGFKPKIQNIRLLGSEKYFEPYLIIEGRYMLDYCKKHLFKVDVDEGTNKVFVAGQEFTSEQSDSKGTNKIIRLAGEEYAHHERQAYFILDRMKREISPEKLPFSPFDIKKREAELSSNFKSINIPDDVQIEFLKTKLAKRPPDVVEIIKEVFEITERTVAYYPMYQLTFENVKNREDAAVTVNGITGEIVLNGTRKLAVKTIVSFPESGVSGPIKLDLHNAKAEPILNIRRQDEAETVGNVQDKDNKKARKSSSEIEMRAVNPARVSDLNFANNGNITEIEGDAEIISGNTVSRNLRVSGTLRIGDNCKIHGRIEALKDVTIGANTIMDGDLISGGNVAVGPQSLVTGSVRALGHIKIGVHTIVEGGLSSNSLPEATSGIQLEVVEVEELR